MTLQIGDTVKTELRADGPRIEATVTGVYPGGAFVEARWDGRDGKKHTGYFNASGCVKVEPKGGE